MENKIKLNFNKTSFPFIVVTTLALGIAIGVLVTLAIKGGSNILPETYYASTGSVQSESSSFIDESYLQNIYDVLNKKYIGSLPSKSEINYGMVKGLISSLNDPYTNYLTPEESKGYNESKNPDFEGIGVTLKFDGENTAVESVLKGYPAEKAGFLPKDVIVKVDDTDVTGQYPSNVASKIRGKKDTSVKVSIVRIENNTPKSLEFNVTRVKIDISNIIYKDLGNGIFQIEITRFIDVTPEAFAKSWDKAVSEIMAKGTPKGIVVDLRNNPGGYVYGVRYVLEEFLPSNAVLLQEERKNQTPVVYKDSRKGVFEDVPIEVLVNSGSASASEIFAGSIQDNNRGKVIGEKTVGKGVEQEVVELDDKSTLIVVFQKWLTPNGRNINKETPIAPDFEIKLTDDDFKQAKDPQLSKALELLAK